MSILKFEKVSYQIITCENMKEQTSFNSILSSSLISLYLTVLGGAYRLQLIREQMNEEKRDSGP